ncbi:MAG: hypothetical protein ACFFCW_39820 [Candidatus Hodarchaeota archaeon]
MAKKAEKPPKAAELSILNDPITETLLNKSTLTQIQFETLLLHFFIDDASGKSVKYDYKAAYRSFKDPRGIRKSVKKKGVTRGAFRRVLGQASDNVIKAIYTLILLAYVGILDTPSIQPYVQLSDMIKEYLDELHDIRGIPRGSEEMRTHLENLKRQIISFVNRYADPFVLAGRKE